MIQSVDYWDDENFNKKAAILRDLAQICPKTENWGQPDPLKILPDKIIDIHHEIPKVLDRIE